MASFGKDTIHGPDPKENGQPSSFTSTTKAYVAVPRSRGSNHNPSSWRASGAGQGMGAGQGLMFQRWFAQTPSEEPFNHIGAIAVDQNRATHNARAEVRQPKNSSVHATKHSNSA